jgi:hypothetical protein
VSETETKAETSEEGGTLVLIPRGWAATYAAGTEHSMEGVCITGYQTGAGPRLWAPVDFVAVPEGHDLKVSFTVVPGKEMRAAKRRKARGR